MYYSHRLLIGSLLVWGSGPANLCVCVTEREKRKKSRKRVIHQAPKSWLFYFHLNCSTIDPQFDQNQIDCENRGKDKKHKKKYWEKKKFDKMEDLKMELFEDVSLFFSRKIQVNKIFRVNLAGLKITWFRFFYQLRNWYFQGEQFPNQQIIKSGLPVTAHYVNHHNHNYQTYQTYETLELYEVKHETDSHDSKHIIQQNRERYIFLEFLKISFFFCYKIC